MEPKKYKIGIISTHPIQYYSPLFRALSEHPKIDLTVYYCHQQSKEDQSKGGFGVEFDWDIPLFDGYKYHFLNNISNNPNVDKFFGCDTPEIYDVIKEEKFDAFIVHGWYVKSYIQALFACWKNNTPVIVRSDSHLSTNRSTLKKLIKYPFYRWFIPKFDGYLYVGKNSKEYYKYYGADEKKMFFSPHAVDNNYFAENSKYSESELNNIKEEFNIPNEEKIFLFVGKLINIKRPLDFLKALKISCERNKNVIGIMAGDGELKNECLNFIKVNNLPVLFLGFVNQSMMPKIYSISDVLVITSESETWGLVVNEAMASGLTVISSDTVGCNSDLIVEDITGKEYTKGKMNILARIMDELINNPQKLSSMKNSAKAHIEEYSIDNNLNGIINALHFVVKFKKHKT